MRLHLPDSARIPNTRSEFRFLLSSIYGVTICKGNRLSSDTKTLEQERRILIFERFQFQKPIMYVFFHAGGLKLFAAAANLFFLFLDQNVKMHEIGIFLMIQHCMHVYNWAHWCHQFWFNELENELSKSINIQFNWKLAKNKFNVETSITGVCHVAAYCGGLKAREMKVQVQLKPEVKDSLTQWNSHHNTEPIKYASGLIFIYL